MARCLTVSARLGTVLGMDSITQLLTRRSVKAAELIDPAPSAAQLHQILTAAMRVPDHGKLAPWRIKLLHKQGQAALARIVVDEFVRANPDANHKQVTFEQQQIERAPLLMAVLYTPIKSHIPEWEQQLSVGAVCMNILHAVHALGFAANWLTEWPAYSRAVTEALGGGAEDKIAGFIYIGTPKAKPDERPRPEVDAIVKEWVG